ncbi:PLP-dependent aminotransferase family protein [Nonomuraea dietziae]|uniref:GntR family transcriptional regulator/MocR family aminotransferase n=1 Tax=Nonomuraea dietziae TaxID=65515 RepID=A0A7W5YQH1_9ACTN|nr:PLP-dependent aminotransferase family protein [Nonomuraea dietziae]MBB3729592.1 GntR family transcriptional regulator/MocR family aminotransferase [Nonomuraea dietziae]
MDFHISLAGRGELAAQIYRQLRDAILDGRLRQGERLPPTRELARGLDVARNTVAVAYERLTADGFLEGRAGAGTFVSAPVRPSTRRRAPHGSGVRPRGVWGEIAATEMRRSPPAFDFRVGTPDLTLFPLESWRRLVTRELRVTAAGYLAPEGHEGLRVAIARYFGVSRSVRAAPDDVIVTQGAQQALDLVGRVLIEPGDCVAVEEPGYPPARRLFHSLGARVAGVPVDAEGLDVTAIPRAARLVYVTPSHQFPLGTPMSLARRTALLSWARQRDAVVIEDDYDSEFRFEDRPLEPLQSLDRSGRVIYVGSFSKTLAPMLRLGFLVAPASLQPALRVAKQLTDWHSETTAQAALARFIDEGLLARHVRRATRQYAARHALIAAFLREHLDLVPSAAGLHLCAKGEVDPARAPEVAVESLPSYYAGPSEQGVVLGYGGIPLERIGAGLRRLIPALRVRPLSL